MHDAVVGEFSDHAYGSNSEVSDEQFEASEARTPTDGMASYLDMRPMSTQEESDNYLTEIRPQGHEAQNLAEV